MVLDGIRGWFGGSDPKQTTNAAIVSAIIAGLALLVTSLGTILTATQSREDEAARARVGEVSGRLLSLETRLGDPSGAGQLGQLQQQLSELQQQLGELQRERAGMVVRIAGVEASIEELRREVARLQRQSETGDTPSPP